ncbi:hypothetical protein [Dongia mobilis]|nr:hypothetical protein [Dongia mobilis]
MDELFADGSIVIWILALVAVEAIFLGLYCWRMRRGPWPGEILFNLAAGAALLLALHGALVDAAWESIGLWLVIGLMAHIADLAVRWRR